MGNVTVSIGGRSHALACADGEEAHVQQLAQLIDEKARLSGATGQTEARMLLFAALMLADELLDLRGRAAAPAPASAPAPMPDEVAERLGALAARVENLADLLESDAAKP
ncbi:cell division protein ZapA [Novosphingobium soli]|uniref:Cell division protein ZapA n=1 Tax=Novosphingobium soli TaxID=574956 RepID=A0ABV6CXK4_9SPHN